MLRPRRVASAVHGQVGAAVPAVGFRIIRSNVIYNFALFDLHLYSGDAMVTPRVAASSASCRLTKAAGAQYQSSCHPESAASAATTAHAHAQPCGCCASSKCVESKERDEGLNESSRPDCSLAGEPSKRCEAEMPSADRIRGICTQDACKCERLRMTPCRARQALTTARPSPPVVPPPTPQLRVSNLLSEHPVLSQAGMAPCSAPARRLSGPPAAGHHQRARRAGNAGGWPARGGPTAPLARALRFVSPATRAPPPAPSPAPVPPPAPHDRPWSLTMRCGGR